MDEKDIAKLQADNVELQNKIKDKETELESTKTQYKTDMEKWKNDNHELTTTVNRLYAQKSVYSEKPKDDETEPMEPPKSNELMGLLVGTCAKQRIKKKE
jgi:hypothetical protein